ncbi:PREDICTED: uncharacterized protein LOC104809701 [Tarenaya hassleriana]|uniref:uncharacterized protein LOC104809701 n=1 Tax=Tarenaya hassleriana TaxID=28532 RepID=UPI00053C5F6A|nr:PREDICTED: uncharacterized protein LOC104809701 [Tarenaya hassleriana]
MPPPPPPPAAPHAARPEGGFPPPPPMPAPPRIPQEVVVDYYPFVKELRALGTPEFEGSLSPKAAEDWIIKITHHFNYIRCPLEYCTELVSRHLAGAARHWWEEVVREAPAGHQLSWEEFRTEFEQKYYRRQDQGHRITEFLRLEQGNMTVREYEAEFNRLLKYGGHLVHTEEYKIQKFIAGLRASLRRIIECHEYHMLSRYINQLEKVERIEKEKMDAKIQDCGPYRREPVNRPPVRIGQTSQPRDKGKALAFRTTSPTQPVQYRRPCAKCEYLEEADVAAITGIICIHDVACVTLFDTGATHSFLSEKKAGELSITEIDTTTPFMVCTPVRQTLPVQRILHCMPLTICGMMLNADLIVVPIRDYDLILGMDWLSKHQAQIDCRQRTIWFTEESGGFEFVGNRSRKVYPIILALKANKMIEKGNEAFMVVITTTKKQRQGWKILLWFGNFPMCFLMNYPDYHQNGR